MSAEYLVTGGAGFIGSNLVQELVRQGRAVRVLDNFSTGLAGNLEPLRDRIEVVEGDVRDVAAVRRAMAGARCVFHLAALPSVARSVADPVSTHEANITGTLNVLMAARDAGVERLVFSSSSSVYGDTPTLPKRESMAPQPRSPYALSKLAGEYYGRIFHSLYGLATFSLRYFNVFGPRQNPQSQYAAVIPLFIDALAHDRAPVIHGDGGQTRDFTFVEDVVRANLCCLEAPREAAGQVYNVAWGNRIAIRDLALELAGLLGKNLQPVHVEARPGDVRDSQADASLARAQLNWQPQVTFRDGLAKTIAWFRGTSP